jgi:hypothetical protein
MLQCSIRIFNNDGAEVVHTFEFHPELLTSESTKLSFDQSFETVKSKACAIKLDTYPKLPIMGLKSLASIKDTVTMLEGASELIGKEITSPIQVTRLKTKTGWMIVLEGK